MNVSLKNSVWIPWMRRALQLAALAEGNVSPNPLVGAIVLNIDGVLVGEGFHSKSGGPHAEINALLQAGIKAKGGTLIVTLEPCCHYGKTPPCTEAIINAGIVKVIVALKDPDPRVSGNGLLRLKQAGIEVECGILSKEAEIQNKDFIFRVTTGRPFGILKWAMSLDGRIALPNGASKWISGIDSRHLVHKLRAKCDAVIIGGSSVRKDNPLLTTRGISNPEPLRVVFSKSCNFSCDEIIWNTAEAKTLLAYGPGFRENAENLKLPTGAEFLLLQESSPKALLNALAEKDCNSVLWECGPSLATLAIQENCVQELVVFIAPKLLGGLSAKTPLADFGFTKLEQALPLGDLSLHMLDKDLLLKIPFNSQNLDFPT